ncbi:MAG: SPOR domain-containing protein [Acetobacteraceae bacterium]|nr:SPOR domain-containing protein [Acetobacteraceae bacterium]
MALSLMRSVALAALLGVGGCNGFFGWGRTGSDSSAKLPGIFLNAGAPEAALRAADEVLVRQPRSAEVLAARAEALVQLGRLDEAQQAYAGMIAANPSAVEPRLALGRMLIQTNPQAAEQVFAEVLQRQPGNAIALNNLGIARDLQGRHIEAQSAYRAARAADPKMTGASVNLGLSQVLAGDMSDAVRTLTPLASLPDASVAVQENLGIALAASGDTAGAARMLGRVLSPAEVTAALAQARRTVAPIQAALAIPASSAFVPTSAAPTPTPPTPIPPTPTPPTPAAPTVAAPPVAAAPPAVSAAVASSPVASPPVVTIAAPPATAAVARSAAAAPGARAPLATIAVPAARVEALAIPPLAIPSAADLPQVPLSPEAAIMPPAVVLALPDASPAAAPSDLPLGVPIAVPIAPGVAATMPEPAAGQAYAQLAMAPSAARARLRRNDIRAAQGPLLSGRSLVIAASTYRDQPTWAVRAGPFASPRKAYDFCAKLLSAGQDCWAMTPSQVPPAHDVTLSSVAVAPIPEATASEPPAAPRPTYAQLAASDTESGVAAEWVKLRRRLGPLLHDREEITLAADVSGRTVWRLRTGPFQQPREAKAFCAEVRAAGGGCWAANGS